MKADDKTARIAADGDRTPCRKPALILVALVVAVSGFGSGAFAQEDMLKLVETKRIELKDKEETLKREEKRLTILKKDVDDKIAAYTKLLAQVEASIKKFALIKDEKLDGVVKAYEIMPPEDAAARLAVLDNDTVLQIMTRMKSKKAGAIIALIEPRKAAALTRRMTKLSTKSEE